jgi:hypothetical protein
MWPVSFKVAQTAMRKYKKKKTTIESDSESDNKLPQLPRPAKSYHEAQMALAEFHKRIPALLGSSPSRNRWNQTHGDAQKYLSRGSLHELGIFYHKAAKAEEIKRKTNSRKSLHTGGSFTASDALFKIKTKRINEAKDDLRKAERLLQDSNRRALQKHKRDGINARKAERERLKTIKELQQSSGDRVIDLQFFPPIRDPTKKPTPQELEDLLPNPSLQQGVDQAKQRLAELDEQELPAFTDLQIDPQILADEKARYPRIYIGGATAMFEEEGQGKEEEEEDITILGVSLSRVDNGGHAGLDWEDTRSVVSDDSMNADFISFNM